MGPAATDSFANRGQGCQESIPDTPGPLSFSLNHRARSLTQSLTRPPTVARVGSPNRFVKMPFEPSSSSSTKLSNIGRCLLIAALSLFLTGCPMIVRGPSQPHVDGEWIGRIVAVKVFDQHGREYVAAALDVLKGPKGYEAPDPHSRYPLALAEYVRKRLGPAWSGRVALLVTNDANARIISPERVPTGQKVSVSGSMMVYHAQNPPRSGGDAPVARAEAEPDSGFREQVLFVEGPIWTVSE